MTEKSVFIADEKEKFIETVQLLSSTVASIGVKAVDVVRNMGYDVIEAPDGEICNIVDAVDTMSLSESELPLSLDGSWHMRGDERKTNNQKLVNHE